jgi:hypothetical protein
MRMEFEIDNFADGFKNTIGWILKDSHGHEIKKFLRALKDDKNRLEKEPDSIKALILLTRLIKTGGFRLREPKDFGNKLESFRERHSENFRTSSAKSELIQLVGPNTKKTAMMEQFLTKYPTLKIFTEDLHSLANQGKTNVLGAKGRDNYLRDLGYWDRIPIDRHQLRFIVRTGIYHVFGSSESCDHLNYNHLHCALTKFCNKCLKNYVVEDIDLGNAPGVVDAFIWTFSAENQHNICGARPRCNKCPLNDACLYSILQPKK